MNRKLLYIAFALMFVVHFLPLHFVSAVGNNIMDLTGDSKYLTVHGTDYVPAERASSLKITEADGVTVISPNADGSYSDIPANAKIFLEYAFSLSDGDGIEIYDYTGDEYFNATLPTGLNFTSTPGTIVATDAVNGQYDLARYNIDGNTLKFFLTNASEDTKNNGGAANDIHQDKWGKVSIEGTFKPLNAGDGTVTEMVFGQETIIINRQPLPMKSTLEKSGSYDASTNEITWTVTINPPLGDPNMAYDGYSVIDNYSSNQNYVPGSFKVGATDILDTDLTIAGNTITYIFPDTTPDTTGVQTIKYKTKPNTFVSGSAEYNNTVNLDRNGETAANPKTATLNLSWLSKTGAVTADQTDDIDIVKWTVTVSIPGTAGKSIDNAKIIDTINDNLELLTGVNNPVQIKFGSGAAVDVASGANAGQYSYNTTTNELTYLFPTDNKPTAGTTAVLTFYTKVKDANKNDYLNNNNRISFTNTAKLSWSESLDLTKSPSSSYTTNTSQGIGSGGLLSKSASGSGENYTYIGKDIIRWTITVNRNKIDMFNARIIDTIPANQQLLIDGSYPFKVIKAGDPLATVTIDTPASTGGFNYDSINTPNQFLYQFGNIDTTYTVEYYTKIIDHSSLYKNGTVGFGNSVTLMRDGETSVSTNGTKNFNSQMVLKSIATNYDYEKHILQWQIVVNRNKLPLNGAIVTDTLPAGMTLFIDGSHPFEVTALGGGDIGSHTAVHDGTAFTFTLPSSTSDQYTVKFWTKLSDEKLQERWAGTKDFTNKASLDSNEIGNPIESTATAAIKNPVITKSYEYDRNGDRSDTIDWTVIINQGQITLTDAVVTDVLHPDLGLDLASVKLYTIFINPATGERDISVLPVLVDANDYQVDYTNNTLSVALPQSTNSAYWLKFSTIILADSINLTNTVGLSGSVGDPSGTTSSGSISVTNLYSSGGSGSNTLIVHKIDKDGNPLQGATFRLVNANKQPIKRGGNDIIRTTGVDGNATFDSLPSWVFYVEETEPAPGYLIPTDSFSGGNRLSGTETISVENKRALVDVSISKTGAASAPLSGGTFTLTGKNENNTDVLITASAVNGVVTFKDVPPNKTGQPYIIRETVAPSGHELNATTISATVEYNASKNGLDVSLSNNVLVNTPEKCDVSFTKTGLGGTLLSGGTFTLSGKDYKNSDITMTASAVNGVVSFNQVPIGDYVINEMDSPSGYLMPTDKTILKVKVSYNNDNTGVISTIKTNVVPPVVVTSYENKKGLGDISFTKVDFANNTPLSGGTFTLTGKDYAGNDVSISSTSIGGTVTFSGVPIGDNYTIKEVTPPAGYRLTDKELKASVKYNADKTAVVTSIDFSTLTNSRVAGIDIFAKILVIKTDENGNKLSGAEFTLYDGLGKVIAKAISNDDGVASFDNIVSGYGYSIRETKAPVGYEPSDKTINFSVTTPSTQTFTVVNKKSPEKPGSISILKKDNSGKVLSGAEFTLYDSTGKIVESVISKTNGIALFNSVPAGTYTVKETLAPLGYIIDSNEISITVKSDETLWLAFKNKKEYETLPIEPVGKLEILKVDKNQKPLKGAELTIYDKNGEVIAKVVSGSNGMAIFKGLKLGNYTVRETVAPEGYRLFSESLEVQIKTDKTLTYTLINIKTTDDDWDVAGWKDGNDDKDNNNDDSGILPKAGGVSIASYMIIIGMLLILTGVVFIRIRKQKNI